MVWLFFLMAGGVAVMGQSRQDVPGDDFSLEGALELFKKSASPEEFERALNTPGSKVNNLDLNGDGDVDYIRVIDRNEGNVHAFIMQAVVSNAESQDVAVIELEKLANGKAVLQITGDEDVYGIETIIEPTEEVRVNAGTSTARTVVNVWTWPSVRYVYSPYYTVWVSPWHWTMRPVWWYTWRPIVYYDYYSYWYPYRRYYSTCHTHRVVYARTIYRPYRTYSPVYYKRHETRIVNYRSTHRDYHNRYDDDRNRSNDHTLYQDRSRDTNDRTNRDRYEGGSRDYKVAERTPVVKDRSGAEQKEKNILDEYRDRDRKEHVDRKPDMKRSEPLYTSRSSEWKKPATERSVPQRERSRPVQVNKSFEKREVHSLEKQNGGRSGNGRSTSGRVKEDHGGEQRRGRKN